MRLALRLLGLALLTAALAPASARAHPRADAAVVEVAIFSRADIDRLNELGMDIMSVREGVAQIAAVPGEVDALKASGFFPVVVFERMRDEVHSLTLPGRGEYHSYA